MGCFLPFLPIIYYIRKWIMAKKLTERKRKWIEKTLNNNRRYKVVAYNRALTCILLLLLELTVSVILLLRTQLGWLWQLLTGALSLLSVVYLAGREQRRPTRMLWIILLLLAPIVGVPAYLLYGDGKPTARLRRRCAESEKILSAYDAPANESCGQEGEVGMSMLLQKQGYPTYYDGDVQYYPTGRELFGAMLDSLKGAKKFVLMEYFILAGGKMWEQLLKLLLQKAEEGVEVKIIYDDFGSIFSLPPHYARYLESLHENVQCLAFNKVYPIFSPSYNHRDHRKIFIVDGEVGFTGGVNIADEYIDEKKRFGYWKDTGIRVRGSAVRSMTKTFLETWVALKEPNLDVSAYLQSPAFGRTGACIIPCADSPLDEVRTSEVVYLEMICRSQDYLYITTPYLVLDESLRTALCLAAMRGVDVRILTPGIPDKKAVYRLTRANYGELLRAGVKIYEYTPGFLHAKMTLSDGAAIVGTTNYDYRSLYLHFENLVYFRGEECVRAVREDFEQMFLVSKERGLSDVKRNFFGRLVDTVLRIFEPLL